MKLSKAQQKMLLKAHGYPGTYCPLPNNGHIAARKTVDGLVKRDLLKWVGNNFFQITPKGSKVYLESIPLPFEVIPREFKSVGDEFLREFVRDVCDNRILTSEQVDQNMIAMVFSPVLFGALSVPEEYKITEPEHPGPEPEKPLAPEVSPKPELLPEPEKPQRLQEIEAEIAQMKFGLEWDILDSEQLSKYLDSVEKEWKGLKAEYTQQLALYKIREAVLEQEQDQWDRDVAALKRSHARTLKQHEKALKQHEKTLKQHKADREWQKAVANRIYDRWLSDLGVVYGNYDSTIGNRVINGYPMLGSCGFLNKADWTLARTAIVREMKRREKEIEL